MWLFQVWIYMAVSLYIIRLTREIDEGNHESYMKLKALAKTDKDAKRVFSTVREPPRPSVVPKTVAPEIKPDTAKQTVEKAEKGDAAAMALLRKKADYEDIMAQHALGMLLMETDPDEARKWFIRSAKMQESMDALNRMASKGDQEARKWLDSNSGRNTMVKRNTSYGSKGPVRDELGYIRPPVKHKMPKIGDIYRLNDAKLQTGLKNSVVLIKEMKGDYVTVWSVTNDPRGRRCVCLIEPWVAGFASKDVYVLTEKESVYRKDSLLEYRGSLGKPDVEQFRLSA